MPTHIDNVEIGEQKGSLRPRYIKVKIFTFMISLMTLSAPLTGFAAGLTYLHANAPDFIDKTKDTYGEMVNIAALLHDYDENMILAVIVVESEGNQSAVSQRGAQGLMQLMPQTAKAMGAKNPKEPFQNILAGTKYLKSLQDIYGFETPEEALVAYNMGPSRAKRWLSQYAPEDYLYVQKVMYVYNYLENSDREEQQLAAAVEARFDQNAKISASAAPLLTKPRNLSLAAFPMVLPSNRKNEVQ